MRTLSFLLLTLALVGCDGEDGPTTPDESGDLGAGGEAGPRVAAEVPRGLDGTQWRWIEAHCTEGPLDLSGRGYGAELLVRQDESSGAVTLITDQEFAAEACKQTVIMAGTPPSGGPDWQIQEVARVAVPHEEACYGRPEDTRPGTVRRSGELLEVLVQRSQWCDGLEVRMVYAPRRREPLTEDQIVRHYAALFTLGNADAIADLFAQTGTLLEPFTRTETGDPFRHEGRQAVERWYGQTFDSAPWRAMRITGVESGQTDAGAATRDVSWEYMDPRLEEPLPGTTRFTIAAGEIFEAQIALEGEPTLREDEAPAEGDGDAEEPTEESAAAAGEAATSEG
jgi:hypothetical protein